MLNADSDGSGIKIINDSDYDDNHFNNGNAGGSSVNNWAVKFPGSIGNSIGVSMCTSATAFEETFTTGIR